MSKDNAVKPSTVAPNVRKDLSGLGVVMARAMFYRDAFRNLVKINTIMAFVAVIEAVIITMLAYALIHKEKIIVGMSADGRITQIVPLTEPSVSDSKMLQLVGDTATCAFTFDYVNYRKQITQCQHGFTDNGWTRFVTELDNSKILNLVKSEELVLSSTRIEAPIIEDKGLIEGVLAWKVKVPVRVTYSGRQTKTTEDYMVSMTVARMDQNTNPDGVAISSFVASIYKDQR